MKTLIFTDMDGTLLDYHTYDFAPALPIINELKALNIPIILTTSKTKSEILWWQEKLKIHCPFIPENGSAIYIPKDYDNLTLPAYPPHNGWHCISLGKSYDFITTYLATIKDKYSITCFSGMDIETIIKHTGLDSTQAQLAREREFSEPFIIENPELVEILRAEAALYGLAITEGGRFFHCLGRGADKGAAMRILSTIYRRHEYDITTIALGDSPNDLPILNAANFAIIIPNPSKKILTCKDATIAPSPGPRGWAQAIKETLCL